MFCSRLSHRMNLAHCQWSFMCSLCFTAVLSVQPNYLLTLSPDQIMRPGHLSKMTIPSELSSEPTKHKVKTFAHNQNTFWNCAYDELTICQTLAHIRKSLKTCCSLFYVTSLITSLVSVSSLLLLSWGLQKEDLYVWLGLISTSMP
jgi:hypothetical protein